MIRHVWFDFSETLVFLNQEKHDQLRYETYAHATRQPVTPELIREYEALYRKHGHANAAVFRSLGFPSSYWAGKVAEVDPGELYQLADPNLPRFLEKLSIKTNVSLFSNVISEKLLNALGMNPVLFTHILSGGELPNPKPALDGYRLIIQKSGVPPAQILYIGDNVEKDVRPAKSLGIQTGLMWSQSPEADYCFERFDDILKLDFSKVR